MATLRRSRILFITTGIISLVLVFFFKDIGVSYSILYAFVMLFLLSAVSMAMGFFLIKADINVSRSVVSKNEYFTYELEIENRGPFHYFQVFPENSCKSICFQRGDGSSNNIIDSVSLRPFNDAAWSYNAYFPYRGVYELGIEGLYFVDFLGLFRFSRSDSAENYFRITVLPSVDHSFTLPIRQTPQDSAPQSFNILSQPTPDISNLRNYYPSDELKKIHWKLSAKKGELIVKEYQPDTVTLVRVFLDTKIIELDGDWRLEFEDLMVGYVASALNYCVNAMVSAELYLGKSSSCQLIVDKPLAFTHAMSVLSSISFDERRSQAHNFLRRLSAGESTAELVLMLSSLDNLLYDEIAKVLGLGNHVIIYFFLPRDTELSSDISTRINSITALGGSAFIISSREVREWTE